MNDIFVSGPLFDGRAAAAAHLGTFAIREAVAKQGVELVRQAFAGSIQDNQGRFIASVRTTDHSVEFTTNSGSKSYTLPVVVDDPATTEVVTTDLASYGPWLEGTGSRNQTTRFKGYHGFRRAGQQLDHEAEVISSKAIVPYVLEMN